ncbi:protein-disulfide reductase DsbD [Superficieibacter electus]|uniref:protein-disulfide reductase DsbD n=1 Tax=Superficieibacter electus TaxID=2022662 RepID=UPI002108AECD|nr:protein-disulfide reductase DsbD [Superficieibacter electus]
MAQRILTLILLLCSTSAFAGLFDAPGRSNFVPADQAFAFDFQQNQRHLTLNWLVKDGYYLYRQQIKVTASQADIAPLQLPTGESHEDEFFGKSEIYRQQLSVPVTVQSAGKGATLTVTYQGCAAAGFCYPPETKVVPVSEVRPVSQERTLPLASSPDASANHGEKAEVRANHDAGASISLSPGERAGVRANHDAGASIALAPGERAGVRANHDAGASISLSPGERAGVRANHDAGASISLSPGERAGVRANHDAGASISLSPGERAGVRANHDAGASISLSPGERAGVRANHDTGAHTELPFTALWALLIGIGIAFTPCVLPMYPLISGIVLGGQQRLSTSRALLLAFIYVQGMALTYTALGLVVAAAGLQFQAALQHPYVLIGLSIVFTLLALSMFGLFTLQLPSSLQTRLTLISNRQQGGSPGGVFAMGAIAGLICSPCTTAPLSAILLYIAQSGNLWLGGGTLYLYALGMGLPLILVTVFGNRLLPKSGPWMEQVKTAFGFIILALPVFLLERIVGDVWGLRLWALLGIAFFGWAFITSLKAQRAWMRAVQIVLLGAALICARPLQDWAFGAPGASEQSPLNFTRITNVDELDRALGQAQGKPVMLDLYADWCVACKEFEKYTFSDPQVRLLLAKSVLLQANVTANSADDIALLKRLNVLGLPTILFFDAEGTEHPETRITGFMDAPAFHTHLQNLPR